MRQLILNSTSSVLTPARDGDNLSWNGLSGSAEILAVTELAQAHDNLIVVVTADSSATERWTSGINFFAGNTGEDTDTLDVLRFPDWETLPYDVFSPHQDIISERLASLSQLHGKSKGDLTVPISTWLRDVSSSS